MFVFFKSDQIIIVNALYDSNDGDISEDNGQRPREDNK